jgi:hypothetical protein
MSRIRLTDSAKLRSRCPSGMALFGYWLPKGSFSVAVKAMQEKGKQTYKRQMLQERPVQLHNDQYG